MTTATTEYTAEMAHKAAERGAAWLDEKCPDWVSKINTDLLDLAKPDLCILGQTANCLVGPAKLTDFTGGGYWRCHAPGAVQRVAAPAWLRRSTQPIRLGSAIRDVDHRLERTDPRTPGGSVMTTDTTPAVDVETPVDFEQVNAALVQRNADLEDHNVNLELQLAAAQRALRSRIEQDGARQVGRRVPIRTAEMVSESLLVSVEAILTELKRSNSAAREGAVSSVAIEDMAKGPPKITTKLYLGSPLIHEDVDEALDAHGYAHREAERRALAGWVETVDALQNGSSAT